MESFRLGGISLMTRFSGQGSLRSGARGGESVLLSISPLGAGVFAFEPGAAAAAAAAAAVAGSTEKTFAAQKRGP